MSNYICKLNENVERIHVRYHNRYGIALAGDLYTMKNMDKTGKHPAVVVGAPYGGVKEQGPSVYANELASRGFVVLTFDPCYMGESGGEPRHVSSPDLFSENISAGVDYLGLLPYVDREKIAALGICGSGVIDGVAGLLESGLLEDTGYLEEDVCFAGNVGLTAEDIREVQLAKGAIRAGMETLLAEEKIDAAGLEGLYVAGGFGSYMSAKSAERIGLFPKIDLSRIKICGNAALAGAVRILHDRRLEKEATALAERAKTINLGSSAKFQEFYMEYMMFDE